MIRLGARTLIVLSLSLAVAAQVRAQSFGTAVAWGYNDSGQCDVPEPISGFYAVVGGGYHSLGLKTNGTLVAWGRNDSGQCDVPQPNSGFMAIAGGQYHSLGLRVDGSIVAWGWNNYGQCAVPTPNAGFVAVAQGPTANHSLAVRADGSIAAWGYNFWDQCDVPEPNTGFVSAAAGRRHSLGLHSDGSIAVWGREGDLPDPNSGFVAIAAGDDFSLGLKTDGTIVAWGSNYYGQCDVPEPNSGFVAIAATYTSGLGLRENGEIVAWGFCAFDECDVPLPNTGFVSVAGGRYHALGLVDEGPVPPFLLIESPASDETIQQGERLTISWIDDSQPGAQINLFYDPDTGPTPWDEGGVHNEIPIPFSVDASDPHDRVEWHVADRAPGVYSVWGKSDNGIDPPAYSRAPGLITVTEFTDDTPPTIDQDRIDLGFLPSPFYVRDEEAAPNLYFVTHGWNGPKGWFADHSWIEHTARAVHGQIDSSEGWDVVYYDWKLLAGGGLLPDEAVVRATMLGRLLGLQIHDAGYQHVEIVAYSAGVWLADAISYAHPDDMTVNLTLLDAFVPPGFASSLGEDADHVFNCYDDGLPFWTQKNLSGAFNVDMTCRREEGSLPEFWPYTGSSHGAPYAWYRESTRLAGGYFMDDDTYADPHGVTAPLAFKMSKAYDGGSSYDMSRYPANGDQEFNVCGNNLWDGCDADTTVFVEYPEVFDFTALTHSVGPDGTVALAPDSVELTTGTEFAWVGFDVPMPRAVSAVIFDVEFTSADPDAQGYATMHWNGLHLTSADERVMDGSDPGMRSFTFLETIAPGQKVISFRVDNNGGPTSSVLISNLRTGINLDVDINGDCVATVDDLCAWAAEPFDLDGNGVVDADDQAILATALGVSGADTDGDGIPDVCEVCAPDLNGDGLVNTQDFIAFLNAWANGDPIADWDENGSIDTRDFVAYLNDWVAGC